jgi:hypothetical protein
MEKMVTEDLGSQASNNKGSTNGVLFIIDTTTIMYPKVRGLAFTASNKVHKIVLKQAAGFKRKAKTESH